MRPSHLAAPALLMLAIATLSPTAQAAWPHDPSAGNVPVCTAAGDQSVYSAIPDGFGGTIIAWWDYRSAALSDIYVQRLDAGGAPLWTANGVAVCTSANYQLYPVLISDGSGGAIVAWQDFRNGANYDLYAQRVNAAGAVQWAANGVAISTAAGDQSAKQICSDGAGGAFIVWQDLRSVTSWDIYAQRVNGAGVVQWAANGLVVSNATSDQISPVIVPDGATGAVVAWQDFRNGNGDIFAQKLSASGSSLWTANGFAVCTSAGNQTLPAITPNGTGGAIIAWQDGRSGTSYDIYAQNMHSLGQTEWTFNGAVVSTAAADQVSPEITADGSNGAVVAWTDYRNGNFDVYAQRLNSSSTPLWTADGIALCTHTADQSLIACASDGSGGAIVTWQDIRSGIGYDIYAQRVNGSGSVAWTFNGAAISTTLNTQTSPVIAADLEGGAVIAWTDYRASNNADIYAQRIDHFGQLGDAEPVISSIKDVRNDQGGFVKLAWDASYLDADPTYLISEYRVYRSVPALLATAAHASRAITEDSDVAAREGALLARASATGTTYWELLGTQVGDGLAGYSRVCATTADSIPGSFPRTLFMVEARTSTSLTAPRWFSAPDSGYSVDNLAPAAPAPFTGQYSSGTTTLHWNRNTEADLAGYRLYRGASAAFVPGPANFVTALADTGAADAAGAPYVYKLTAIDSHGNESPVATLVPTGTLGVSGGAAASLSFAAPSPNPARGATMLRFSLPKRGPARLSVYDAAGRHVQTLHDGALEAGAHTMAFVLRDDAGHALPSGLYLVRLEAEGRVITRRLAAVK